MTNRVGRPKGKKQTELTKAKISVRMREMALESLPYKQEAEYKTFEKQLEEARKALAELEKKETK